VTLKLLRVDPSRSFLLYIFIGSYIFSAAVRLISIAGCFNILLGLRNSLRTGGATRDGGAQAQVSFAFFAVIQTFDVSCVPSEPRNGGGGLKSPRQDAG
jgi:hypothetical protein